MCGYLAESPSALCGPCSKGLQALDTWTLFLGIHRGTLTSRDSEQPRTLSSLEACREEAGQAESEYRRMGCQIWFGYATGPAGERVKLLEGEPYWSGPYPSQWGV